MKKTVICYKCRLPVRKRDTIKVPMAEDIKKEVLQLDTDTGQTIAKTRVATCIHSFPWCKSCFGILTKTLEERHDA